MPQQTLTEYNDPPIRRAAYDDRHVPYCPVCLLDGRQTPLEMTLVTVPAARVGLADAEWAESSVRVLARRCATGHDPVLVLADIHAAAARGSTPSGYVVPTVTGDHGGTIAAMVADPT